VLLETPEADHREGLDLTPIEPTVTGMEVIQQLYTRAKPPAFVPADEIGSELTDTQIARPASPRPTVDVSTSAAVIQPAPTFAMPPAQTSALSQRLEHLA
jgi:hypothetical protein